MKIPLKRSFLIFTIALSALASPGRAQQYDPFDGNAQAFHANLSRYFKSPASELTSRKLLFDSVKTFRADSVWAVPNLLVHLNKYEHFLTSLQRHYQYHRLLSYINNKDTVARKALAQTGDVLNDLDARVNKLLLQPKFANLTSLQIKKYGLSRYSYLLTSVKRDAAHGLNANSSKQTDRLSSNKVNELTDKYDNLMNDIKVTDVSIDGKTYKWTDYSPVLSKTKDVEVKAAGLKAYYDAYYGNYAQHADTVAATLINITRQKIAMAKLRGFASAPEQVYGRKLQLPENSVRQMLQQMTMHAGVLKAYQQLLMEQTQRATSLKKVRSWDNTLATGGYTWKPLPYVQVNQLILKALSPLGKDYQQNFAHLLNPANGRLEIADGPNKVTENTSIGYPGVPIGLYIKTYTGSLKSVLKVAHEGGHAIHEQLMSNNGIVPSYVSGPSFLFEAYAMLNELLMLDELQQQATTTEGKAYFTRQFLDKLALEVFQSAEEGAFEQGLYDGVAAGRINNRTDIDNLYSGIMHQYDIYFADEPQRRSEWINKRLVFDDPLYNINYLYAILVTCKLYNMQHADPAGFAIKYNALLKNGFDAPAEDLLKKCMGFGLDNNALLNGTLKLMQDKTEMFKKLMK